MQGKASEVFARAKELVAVGLNIPEISRMCLMLRERGIEVDEGVFTVEQAEECLLRLWNERNKAAEVKR